LGELNQPILYLKVDKLPMFDRGKSDIDSFINENLSWPRGFDGQGTVLVSFVVKKDGSVSNLSIVRSLCKSCDEEVFRLFELMPEWEPAIKDGKTVDVLLYLPILFKIS